MNSTPRCLLLVTLLVMLLCPVSTLQAAPLTQSTVTLTLQNTSAAPLGICDRFLVNHAAKLIVTQHNQFALAFGSTEAFDVVPSAYPLLTDDCVGQTLFQHLDLQIAENYTIRLTKPNDATTSKQNNNISQQCEDLNQAGKNLYQHSEFTKALQVFDAALVCTKQTDSHTLEGTIRSNIGLVYAHWGRYGEALVNYQQALKIAREVGDRVGEGRTLTNIGAVYANQGNYLDSLANYQQALKILREIGDRTGEGGTLNRIGAVYANQGDYLDSLANYQQALNILREIGDRVSERSVLHNIGGVYAEQGRYAKALTSDQQALKIAREIGDRAGEGESLYNISAVYNYQGRYVEALSSFQQALKIMREVDYRKGEGSTLNYIGVVYEHWGRYDEALYNYQQALKIEREVGDRAGEGTTLHNVAAIYSDQGRYIEALDNYQRALKIAREINGRASEGTILNNIARVYDKQRRYIKALASYQDALKIAREIGNRAGEGRTLNSIGVVYAEQGRYTEALNNYHQALEIQREVGDHAGEGITRSNIGVVYGNQGRYGEAHDSYQQALKLLREAGDLAGEGTTLNIIGQVYQKQERYVEALDSYQVGIDVLESVRAAAGNDSARASFSASFIDAYKRVIELTFKTQPDLAFWYSERSRARIFLDSLATGTVQLSDENANALLAQEQESYTLRQVTQDKLALAHAATPPDPKLVADLEPQLKKAEQQHAAALAAIDQHGGQLAALVPGRTQSVLTLPEVQQRLDPQTTLVAYDVLKDQTLAFVITHDYSYTVALPVTNGALITQVQTLREFANVNEAHPASAIKLYNWLIDPLKPYLTTSHLIIVPHGVLHYLPFAALTDGKRFLVDDYTLTTLPSASTLQFIQPHPALTNTLLLIVGNPTTSEVPPLNNAEQEARTIAKLYDVTPLLGTAATTTAVRQRAAQANILHLAAHGTYNLHDPLGSTLYLAPSATVTDTGHVIDTGQLTDTGHLTVRDIYSWKLNNTNLVVLSACETQMNELSERNIVSAGDDIVGLTRAFFFAGASSVLATLWSVDDRPTEQLMEKFYANLRQGMGKAEALRQAQLAIRQDYPNPYYWAGFVLSGDGGPLNTVLNR